MHLESKTKTMLAFHKHLPKRTFILPLENFTVGRFNELRVFVGDMGGKPYVRIKHSNDIQVGTYPGYASDPANPFR